MILTMRYRPLTAVEWAPAKTVNISRSGVLFESDAALDPGAAVEMLVELGDQQAQFAALRCSATIVRNDDNRRIAARFFDYQLTAWGGRQHD